MEKYQIPRLLAQMDIVRVSVADLVQVSKFSKFRFRGYYFSINSLYILLSCLMWVIALDSSLEYQYHHI